MSASTGSTGGLRSIGASGGSESAVAGLTFGATAVSALAGVTFTLTVMSRWRSKSKKWESGTLVTYLIQRVTGQRSTGPKRWPSPPRT
jgi:hypothetical protein